MAIEVNFNNKDKHWILIILGKIKNGLKYLCHILWYCLQRTWKYLLGVFVAIVIVILSILGYTYYTKEYYPEKVLKEAVEKVISDFRKEKDPHKKLKKAHCFFIEDFEWKYKDVNDTDLNNRLVPFRDEAFAYVEKRASEGDASSQYTLGNIFYFNKEDFDKAAYWWNEAAKQGYVKSFNNIGSSYLNGEGVEQNLRKGVEWIRKGAEAGEEMAQQNLGRMYAEGIKVKSGSHKELQKTTGYGYHPGKKIREYYDHNTMDFVKIYQVDVDDYEILIPQDINKAKEWWRKSAAQGNEKAKELLQKIYN